MDKIVTTFSFCGTKNKLLNWLKANINFNPEKEVWIEPFCGSCVVGFNFRPKIAIFADANPHLIDFYNFIKNDKNSVEKISKSLDYYREGITNAGADFYYTIRERFNKEYNIYDFFFLSRCGFSHQLRYNRKGELNMAYGKFNDIANRDSSIIKRLEIIKDLIDKNHYDFVNISYTDLIPKFNGFNNAFFYLDPPYVGTNQDYNASSFNENHLDHLIQLIDETGCKFAMSGNCKMDQKDNIIEKYSKYRVEFKESIYTVNSNTVTRASEILVMN